MSLWNVKDFNRLKAENDLSAVAQVMGMVNAVCSKLKTSGSKLLLQLTSDMTSHNVLKLVTFLIEVTGFFWLYNSEASEAEFLDAQYHEYNVTSSGMWQSPLLEEIYGKVSTVYSFLHGGSAAL